MQFFSLSLCFSSSLSPSVICITDLIYSHIGSPSLFGIQFCGCFNGQLYPRQFPSVLSFIMQYTLMCSWNSNACHKASSGQRKFQHVWTCESLTVYIIQTKNKTNFFDCDDISVMVFCLEQDCFLDRLRYNTSNVGLLCNSNAVFVSGNV